MLLSERSGLKAPALPNDYFFQIHPRWRFFINNFYLKSSLILNLNDKWNKNNDSKINFNCHFIACRGLKATAELIKFSVDFYWKFVRSTSEFCKHSENKR